METAAISPAHSQSLYLHPRDRPTFVRASVASRRHWVIVVGGEKQPRSDAYVSYVTEPRACSLFDFLPSPSHTSLFPYPPHPILPDAQASVHQQRGRRPQRQRTITSASDYDTSKDDKNSSEDNAVPANEDTASTASDSECHVGFDPTTQQIELKLLKRGFQLNVIVVGACLFHVGANEPFHVVDTLYLQAKPDSESPRSSTRFHDDARS
ncbi:hypothetical protein BDZ89DRAFT_1144423 [Hymenopellis radicata]|nr:hypothetical protein BDZ89DRAFT_1144423 [Hymenopellis radicata]